MDYEKKYKEALGWMQSLYNGLHGKTKEEAEQYFPELAESEDERIRKELLKAFSCGYDNSDIYGHGITYGQVRAWLEKQANHANFRNKIQIGDKVTRNEDGVLVNLSQLNRVAKKDEKQGEQKSVFEMKTPEESLGIDSETYSKIVDECIYGEQKSAWSEVDECTLLDTIRLLCSCGKCSTDRKLWLLSLKDRVQPQNRWKPSDEQMKIVKDAIGTYGAHSARGLLFEDLYQELKKL